jgi:hypothetical protein
MAELRIPIVGEFKGQKAFGQANRATGALEKGVKKLGAQIIAVFSVQKIVQFGKAAAKAFIDDEKAASRLAISVKNLGLAFETPRIEEFISQLARASGVTDDQLRPSMQKLLTTTGSVAKSTELLQQALDISAGSGVDFETVVTDLSMAYVGQTRGLRKYSLGLTQAELKTMSFSDVQEKLKKQFTGASAEYLTTYAGKMGILSNAAGEASENIGKSLMESLSLLAGDGNSIQPLADSMLEFSEYIGDAILGMATLIEKFKSLPGMGALDKVGGAKGILRFLPQIGPVVQFLDYLQGVGANAKGTPGMGGYPSSALGPGYIDPNDAARKKAEAAAAKRAKELAALQKKTLDAQKKSLAEAKKKAALDKASKTLNLEAIGIEAALKGKISETDRLSLQLQKAILEGNATLATQLSDQLEAAIKRNNALSAALLATPKAPNPYEDWKIPKLDFGGNMLGTPLPPGFTPPSYPPSVTNPQGPVAPIYVPPTNVPSDSFTQYAPVGGVGGALGLEDLRGRSGAINVTVVLNDQEVGNAVRDVSVNDSLSGSFNTVNRTGRFAPTAI